MKGLMHWSLLVQAQFGGTLLVNGSWRQTVAVQASTVQFEASAQDSSLGAPLTQNLRVSALHGAMLMKIGVA